MTESFVTHLSWHPMGQSFAYNSYSRLYTIRAQGKPDLVGTAAPEFKGSPYHYNPEDMLVMSLSACHMLSYLAYAANSKIEVLSYHDDARGTLTNDKNKIKFQEVILNPRIVISENSNIEKAQQLHEKAHDACFIANSVNFPVRLDPKIVKGQLPMIQVA